VSSSGKGVPSERPVRRAGPGWSLLIAEPSEGPVTTLVALHGSEGVEFVDLRLTAGLSVVTREPAPTVPARRSLGNDVAADTLVMLALLLGGGLLVPRAADGARHAHRWIRLPPGLLSGVALQIVLGLLLLPWPWSGLAFLAGALAIGRAANHRGTDTGWRRRDALPLLVASSVIVAAAWATRTRGLLVVSNDSFTYWAAARAIALGEYELAYLSTKRPLSLSALHAVGFGLGADGVLSLGIVLLVAAATILALAPSVIASAASRDVTYAGHAIGAGLALLVLTSGWFGFMAVYLNAHLLVATLLLGLVLVPFLAQDDEQMGRWAIPVGVLIGAVALSRGETMLLVGLLLLGTLRDPIRWWEWRWGWIALGTSVAAWNTLLVVGGRSAEGMSIVAVASVALGLVLVVAP